MTQLKKKNTQQKHSPEVLYVCCFRAANLITPDSDIKVHLPMMDFLPVFISFPALSELFPVNQQRWKISLLQNIQIQISLTAACVSTYTSPLYLPLPFDDSHCSGKVLDLKANNFPPSTTPPPLFSLLLFTLRLDHLAETKDL